MPKKTRKTWDVLKFERETEDGGKYYIGEKGKYLFLFNGKTDPAGRVILNRRFLTGLFRPKYTSSKVQFVGDLRGERKFLLFSKRGPGDITIYWTDKRK